MRRATLTLALLALALPGCGAAATSAGEFEGEARRVAEVVEELQEAGQAREGERICAEILARPLVERLGGGGCAEELEDALGDADDFELVVEDVTVQGARAQARVTNLERLRTIELVRQGADWRVASLGA